MKSEKPEKPETVETPEDAPIIEIAADEMIATAGTLFAEAANEELEAQVLRDQATERDRLAARKRATAARLAEQGKRIKLSARTARRRSANDP